MTQAQATMASPEQSSLRERVLRAGGWTIVGHGAGQIIRLASNLIMTRLLVPEMFGIMAIAWIIMTGMQLLSDMGLRQNIVQSRRGDDPTFLGTAWAIQILRGGVLWLAALCIAGMIYLMQWQRLMPEGTVYADPLLCPVVAVLSFAALIAGFESTRIARAERMLAQANIVRMELLSQALGIGCMITWAVFDRTIWALVAGGVVTATTRVALSHLALPGTGDHWVWNGEMFREIVHYGKWIFLTSVLGFAVNNGDRLLLGGLVTPEAMGLYVIAFLIADAITQLMSKLLASVSFPALSEVARDRPAELKAAYYRFRLPIDALTLFTAGALFIAGDAVIDLLFDDRYRGAGAILEILALSLVFVRYGVAEMCCLALGKPRILSMQIAVRGLALYSLIPALFYLFGFEGALWAVVLHRVFSLLPVFAFKIQHGLLDIRKELVVLPIFFVGMLAGAAGRSLLTMS